VYIRCSTLINFTIIKTASHDPFYPDFREIQKSSNPGSGSDEIIGSWENGADDGSGLHGIWGYGIDFFEDGTGIYHSWGNDIAPEDPQQPINWKRNAPKNISIKFSKDSNWWDIEYDISKFTGAYDSKYFKIVEKGKNDFWCSPEPLYKRGDASSS